MSTKLPVALQLYTVRDDAARDFNDTLRHVAAIGYKHVELAGLNGHSAADVRKMLDDHGLTAISNHVGIDGLEKDVQTAIEEAKTLGYQYVMIPYLGDNRRTSIDAYKQFGEALGKIGQELKDAGLTLGYHNHDFEFNKFGGEVTGYDTLFAAADPELVKIELDTFWVQKAGHAPADVIRQYAGRVPLIHLKDMTPAPENTFAEVGEGIMDFNAIFEVAEIGGGKYYIVEQDTCKNHPPLESVKISFENLKKMGIA